MDDWKDQLSKLKEKDKQGSQKNGGKNMPNKIEFLDSSGVIFSELLDEKALEWANSFIEPQSENRNRKKKLSSAQLRKHYGLKSAQLRRFYDDAKKLNVKLQEEKKFEKIIPFIKMMKSKAAYACPKKEGKKKIPEEFKDFITLMVDSIENKEDFEAFLLCFEAVVGYFYGQGGRQQ